MKSVKLTAFELDVVISLLETALSGWEGDGARKNAAEKVLVKLRGCDK